MRVETRSVPNTVTVYIAEDGTEFEYEWRCADHERQCKAREAQERIAGVPHFDATPPFTDDDEEWRWYYVTSQREVQDIAAAFFNSDSSAHEFQPKAFPCWIAAIFTGREDRAGWMVEYAKYVEAQTDFGRRLDAEMVRQKPRKNGERSNERVETLYDSKYLDAVQTLRRILEMENMPRYQAMAGSIRMAILHEDYRDAARKCLSRLGEEVRE